MANTISTEMTKDAITITVSDGNTFLLTKDDVLAHFETESGNEATKKAATIVWAKAQIEAGCGERFITADQVQIDFDPTYGFTCLEFE